MKTECNVGSAFGAAIATCAPFAEGVQAPVGTYHIECRDKDGRTKWVDGFRNTVTTAGKNDLLTQYFKGSAYTAGWFVGLIDNAGFTAIAVGDTMSSHAGWSECTAYGNASRPTLSLGTPAGGAVDNAASVAAFTINATATIKGAFVANNGTKGGTSGTLYSAGGFAAVRSVASGDTLNVTITLSAS